MTDEDNWVELSATVRAVLRQCAELPTRDRTTVEELLRVGETLVAFEIFCTQLDEHGIRLSAVHIRTLERVGRALSARSYYTDILWSNDS